MSEETWPAEDQESIAHCPVCGSRERRLLESDLVDRIYAVATGAWALHRCDGCGSAYIDPRPTPASIGRAYESYYTHDPADHVLVRRIGGLKSLLADALDAYAWSRYGMGSGGLGSGLAWLPWLLPPLRAAKDQECRMLVRPEGRARRVLDIGCGNGGFLAKAKAAGWLVQGLDFDPQAINACRMKGVEAKEGGIEALSSFADGTFDYVTCSHLVEHVHEPMGLLRECFRVLRPGGALWLETPNIESYGYRRYGRHWRGLEPPRHLVLFSRSSLFQALRRTGFSKVRQYDNTLSSFGVLAASEALAQGRDPIGATYGGRPPLRNVLAMIGEILMPTRREFLTIRATKGSA